MPGWKFRARRSRVPLTQALRGAGAKIVMAALIINYTVPQFPAKSSVMTESTVYRPTTPRQTERQSIRGVDYSINTWGSTDNPLMVYLHGWGDTGSTFQFVVDKFRKNWFVVAPDWRGFGESTASATAYWFADYLADLDHLLNHFSPAQPLRLVGHSMGGNVAGLYAGVMPERVQAVVDIEGFGLPDSDPEMAPGRYRAWIEKGKETPAFSEFADFAALAERVRRRSPRMSIAQAEFVARKWAVSADDGKIRLRADPRHKLPNAVLYRRSEAEACWRQVSADVLLVAGVDSDFIAPREAGRPASIPDLPFPRATKQLIEGAGHMLHFEQPGVLAQTIEAFFAKTL